MKRIFLATAFALGLSACGSEPAEPAAPVATASADPTEAWSNCVGSQAETAAQGDQAPEAAADAAIRACAAEELAVRSELLAAGGDAPTSEVNATVEGLIAETRAIIIAEIVAARAAG